MRTWCFIRLRWPVSLFSVCAVHNPSETGDTLSAFRLTGGCDSVLPGGLVVAQGEKHGLDGADEDGGQKAVEDDIEQKDFGCGRERGKNY